MTIRRPHTLALLLLTACTTSDSTGPGGTVSSVSVSAPTFTIDVGLTLQFTATAMNQGGSPINGLTPTWTTSQPTVASISPSGLVTALTVGTSAITANINGVTDAAVLTVEPSGCATRVDVVLNQGQSVVFEDNDDCFLLPSGQAGDRYRVSIVRPTQVGNPSDVSTATLEASPVAITAQTPALPVPTATAALAPTNSLALEGRDGTAIVRALEQKAATMRYHLELRRREMARGDLGPAAALPNRPALAGPLRADPPPKRSFQLDLGLSCNTAVTASPVMLLGFNDDIAFYQDSLDWAASPISGSAATVMADYYTNHVKDMTTEYWGAPSDVDGNGRILVTTTSSLPDSAAAAVLDCDLRPSVPFARSNEAELIYFNAEVMRRLDSASLSSTRYSGLPTLAHEVKHVVSLYHRIAAGNMSGMQEFHPLFIEEGQAEIAGSLSSRIAWAANGGPGVTARVTGQDILDGWQGSIPFYLQGVIENLAGAIIQLSTHPNSLITNPVGANDSHSFYAAGWHLFRFLGDGYGGAGTAPHADGPLFLQLTDSMSARGTAGLVQATGRSYEQLLEDLLVAMNLHETGAPAPAQAFSTYDLVSATQIFSGPPVVNPPGQYPWPLTTDQVTENPSANFANATFAGPIGPSGIRIHDFVSQGAGAGLQVLLSVSPPAKYVVTRLR